MSELHNRGKNKEIGIMVAHYHQKLGPRFLGIAFNGARYLNKKTQDDMLHDAISTRSENLAIFIKDEKGRDYLVRIKKFYIRDEQARGGRQRYALLLLLPQDLPRFDHDINEVLINIKESIESKKNINRVLDSWRIILNDEQWSYEEEEDDVRILKRERVRSSYKKSPKKENYDKVLNVNFFF